MRAATVTLVLAALIVLASAFELNTFTCCSAGVKDAKPIVRLGGLFPISGRTDTVGIERANVMALAIEEINNNTALLPELQLQGWIGDTTNTEGGALVLSFNFATEPTFNTTLWIGSARSAESKISAIVGSVFRAPQISYSSTAATLSDKNTYPFFGRTCPSDALQGKALVALVNHFEWKRVIVLYTNDEYGQSIFSAITGASKASDVIVENFFAFPASLNVSRDAGPIAAAVEVIRTSRVFIIILASDPNGVGIMRAALEAGFVSDRYVWIGTDAITQSATLAAAAAVDQVMAGFIGTVPVSIVGSAGTDFVARWANLNRTLFPSFPNPNQYSPFVYDAVYAFAHTLQEMYDRGTDFRSGTAVYAALGAMTPFDGVTGPIDFTPQGDRIGSNYDVVNAVSKDATTFTRVGGWADINADLPTVGYSADVTAEQSVMRLTFGLLPFNQLPTDVTISYEYSQYSNPGAIVILILTFVALLVLIITMILWTIFIRQPALNSFQPVVAYTIALGVLLALVICVIVVGKATGFSCNVVMWLGSYTFDLVVGSLAIKALFIWIHKLKHPSKIRFDFKFYFFLAALAPILILETIYMIIWSAAAPMHGDVQVVDFNTRITVCAGDTNNRVWFAVWLGIKVAIAVIATIAAIPIANIHMLFKESLYTSWAIGILDVVMICGFAVIWALYEVAVDPSITNPILAGIILVGCAVVWVTVFGQKVWVVIFRGGKSKMEHEIDANFDPTELDRIELM